MVGVEDHGDLGAAHHRVDGESLDELVASHLERNIEESLERHPGVDHVVTVDDHPLHQSSLIWDWPTTISAGSMPATEVS